MKRIVKKKSKQVVTKKVTPKKKEEPQRDLDAEVAALEDDLTWLKSQSEELKRQVKLESDTLKSQLVAKVQPTVDNMEKRLLERLCVFIKQHPVYESKTIYGGVLGEEFKKCLRQRWQVVGWEFCGKRNKMVHVLQRPVIPKTSAEFLKAYKLFFKEVKGAK